MIESLFKREVLIMSMSTGAYEGNVQFELANAPAVFHTLMRHLQSGDLGAAIQHCSEVCLLQTADRSWAGAFFAVRAWCLKEVKEFAKALRDVENARTLQINLVAAYYYYDAGVQSLNMLDRLPEAASAAAEAIKYFTEKDSPPNVANFLCCKANVLKQMAAHLSKDIKTWPAAHDMAKEAFCTLRDSLVITLEGWEEMQKELEALARICARVGCTEVPLGPSVPSDVRTVLLTQFSPEILRRQSSAQRYNLAVDARDQKNDRVLADQYFKVALDAVPESEMSPSVQAWKAFVAYQAGVNLLRLYNLDKGHEKNPSAAEKVRDLWSLTRRIHDNLDKRDIVEFDQRFPPGLTDAVSRIHKDPIMTLERGVSPKGNSPKGENVISQFEEQNACGMKSLKEGNYKLAREAFSKALQIRRNVSVLTSLATAEKYSGSWDQAKAYLEEALDLATNDDVRGLISYNMGNLYRERKLYHEAIPWYRKSAALRPSHVGCHYNLGQSLIASGQYDDAILEYEKVLALEPGHPDARARIELARKASKERLSPARTEPRSRAEAPYRYRSLEAERHVAEGIRKAYEGYPLDEIAVHVRCVLDTEPECKDPAFLLLAGANLAQLSLQNKSADIARQAIKFAKELEGIEERKEKPFKNTLFMVYSSLCIGYFWTDDFSASGDYCEKAIAIEPEAEQMLLVRQWLRKHNGPINYRERRTATTRSKMLDRLQLRAKGMAIAAGSAAVWGAAIGTVILLAGGLQSTRGGPGPRGGSARRAIGWRYYLARPLLGLLHTDREKYCLDKRADSLLWAPSATLCSFLLHLCVAGHFHSGKARLDHTDCELI